jgi:hypothetical protein
MEQRRRLMLSGYSSASFACGPQGSLEVSQ